MQLCDTNVISELVRPRPNFGVAEWSRGLSRVAVSTISVEELSYWFSHRPNPRVRDWIESFLDSQCDLLPVTDEIARRGGLLRGSLAARGLVRSQPDMLIAATAQVHQLTVVTRNVRDFEDCAVALLNPFS